MVRLVCAVVWAGVAPVWAADEKPPRLLVLLVVDQLPVRLLEAARPKLSGALARLTGTSAFRAEALYPYASTYTAPGHALIATGAPPSLSGIPANRWYEDDALVACERPEQLRVETLADIVRRGGGLVAALSLKQRSAWMLAGRDPSVVAWYDYPSSQFIGPEWLGRPATLAARKAERWEPLDPSYYATLWPDRQGFETDYFGLGILFPHPAPALLPPKAFLATPGSGALLTDVVLLALDRLALGSDAHPDLLAVSYSNTDYIGHSFSAESWEALDALLRLDRDLERLLARLDQSVGPDRYAVALTSDHGVGSAPRIQIDGAALARRIQAALAALSIPAAVHFSEPCLWLPAALRRTPAQRRQALELALEMARATPGIAAAYGWLEPDGLPDDAPFAELIRRSLVPGRSGDIYLLPAEDALFAAREPPSRATSHGRPYDSDRRVPLLAAGAGIAPGRMPADADMGQLAPTLARLLNLKLPAAASSPVLSEALQEPPPAAGP